MVISINAIQQGIFNEFTQKRFDELGEIKSDLEVKILQEEMHRPMLKRDQVVFWIHRFRKLDITKPEHRQRLIDSFVNVIFLFDDKIILIFNYKDGCKSMSFRSIMDAVDKSASGSDIGALSAPIKACRFDTKTSRRKPLIYGGFWFIHGKN